ncbi:MAG: YidC/Oxa1 family membrane protein insertase [Minisyncoccales bacterium]|jgi:YidC/Oxa1 family membrane protein insertase
MKGLFYTFFYQPLMNILIVFYQIIPGGDFGVALILLTLLIRFFLYPLSVKGIKSQKAITELQPKVKEIQERYKDDKEKQAVEMMEVYKKANISPFSGFVPFLIQLPVLVALYRALRVFQSGEFSEVLYSFISHPGEINSIFLGFMDLSTIGIFGDNGSFLIQNALIIFGAGIAQFIQMKMTSDYRPEVKKSKKRKNDLNTEMAEKMQKQMSYFLPFFTIFILFKLPIAIGLYWITSTVFSLVQQYIIFKKS